MATVDASWDQFVFRMRAYTYILQVTNLKHSTVYRFSTAEVQPNKLAGSTLLGCLWLTLFRMGDAPASFCSAVPKRLVLG